MPHLHGGVVRSLASVIRRPLLDVLHRQVDAEHATCLSWGVAVCGEGNLCPGSRQFDQCGCLPGRDCLSTRPCAAGRYLEQEVEQLCRGRSAVCCIPSGPIPSSICGSTGLSDSFCTGCMERAWGPALDWTHSCFKSMQAGSKGRHSAHLHDTLAHPGASQLQEPQSPWLPSVAPLLAQQAGELMARGLPWSAECKIASFEIMESILSTSAHLVHTCRCLTLDRLPGAGEYTCCSASLPELPDLHDIVRGVNAHVSFEILTTSPACQLTHRCSLRNVLLRSESVSEPLRRQGRRTSHCVVPARLSNYKHVDAKAARMRPGHERHASDVAGLDPPGPI